jgi:hypothetical protein
MSLLVLSSGCEREITPPDSPTSQRARRAMAPGAPAVTNVNDDGPGSLRAAIAAAAMAETIRFDPALAGRTIPLATELAIAGKTLTVEGPSQGVTLSGGGQHRVMSVDATSNVTLRSLRIVGGNSSGSGGGIANEGTLRLEGVIVDGNTVSNTLTESGGGIFSVGPLTLISSTVSGNVAYVGGGIYSDGVLYMENSTIASNRSTNGGGGIFSSGGGAALVNSTVTMNSTGGRGGGIMMCCGFMAGSETLSLVHSTIVYNRGNHEGSGGIWVQEERPQLVYTFESQYSIVAHNTESLTGALSNCMLAGVSLGPGSTGTPNVTNSGIPCLSTWIVDDKLVGPLADNGGPTKTHALLRDSRAIDAASGSPWAVDQRFVPRPQGLAPDIGAYEFNGTSTVALGVNGTAAVDPRTGAATVTGTIQCLDAVSIVARVTLTQDQKAKRVPTVVSANTLTTIACAVPGGTWSVTLSPSSGAFENGKASASIEMLPPEEPLPWITPVAASAKLTLGWAKK